MTKTSQAILNIPNTLLTPQSQLLQVHSIHLSLLKTEE